jgi:hypothetical protein
MQALSGPGLTGEQTELVQSTLETISPRPSAIKVEKYKIQF